MVAPEDWAKPVSLVVDWEVLAEWLEAPIRRARCAAAIITTELPPARVEAGEDGRNKDFVQNLAIPVWVGEGSKRTKQSMPG